MVALLIQRILNFFTEIFTLFPHFLKENIVQKQLCFGSTNGDTKQFSKSYFLQSRGPDARVQQLQLTLLGCAVSVSLVPEEIKYLIKLLWIVELGSREEE